MSDAYDNVMGGKLNLKGGIKKKKKKKSSSEGDEGGSIVTTTEASSSSSSAQPPTASEPHNFGHTKSELRRLELQQQRKFEKLEAGKLPTHREQAAPCQLLCPFSTCCARAPMSRHQIIPSMTAG